MKTIIDKNTQEFLFNVADDNYQPNENELVIDFVPELPIELTSEQEIQQAIDLEFERYLKRKTDGELAYLKLSAEFRLAKLSGQISEETHSYLEELLTPVRNEVMFGQWKKGLELLEGIGFQIGEGLYNRLHVQITNYINNNY